MPPEATTVGNVLSLMARVEEELVSSLNWTGRKLVLYPCSTAAFVDSFTNELTAPEPVEDGVNCRNSAPFRLPLAPTVVRSRTVGTTRSSSCSNAARNLRRGRLLPATGGLVPQ